MQPRQARFDGILLVDKKAGITSHDVVEKVRRRIGVKKAGHTGTLDPLATGLLILCIGKTRWPRSLRLRAAPREFPRRDRTGAARVFGEEDRRRPRVRDGAQGTGSE